jgi:chorismate synthase
MKMSSTFGTLFKVSSFGESHCLAVGAVVDGVPSGLELSEEDIQPQLDRRRPGQSALTTPRSEEDRVSILSGVENGITLGTPVALMVKNRDQRPGDYQEMRRIPRPSHADYSYQVKYGVRAESGGGRASARETIARVAAGAIAEKILAERYGVEIVAWVDAVGGLKTGELDLERLSRKDVDASPVRSPDRQGAAAMEELIGEVIRKKDSVGGVVGCLCRKVPAGLGEPVFDKLEAMLAHAMLSIPASKGFEIGSGFSGSRMLGSVHNDRFVRKGERLGTLSNYSGGVQGGISNGEIIYFRVAFKPPATIGIGQQTASFDGEDTLLEAKGRHDPCIVPRAVPVVEGMTALVLIDLLLRQEYRLALRRG